MRQIEIEGFTPDEILSLSPDQIDAFVFCNEPITFTAGSARILGEFRRTEKALVVELAQIDGGGEGVLPILSGLINRYAEHNGFETVEWIVHALNCAKPNPKLRPLLERRGFKVEAVRDGVEAYRLVYVVRPVDRSEAASLPHP